MMHKPSHTRVTIRADRISDLMRSLEIDAVGLAYHAGISYDYVYKIVRSERPNVSAINLAMIAQTLGVSIEYLLGMVDEPEIDKIAEGINRFDPVDREWLRDKCRQLAGITSRLGQLPKPLQDGIRAYIDAEINLIRKLVEGQGEGDNMPALETDQDHEGTT